MISHVTAGRWFSLGQTHTLFPGAAGSVCCINRVTYYTWDIWADTAPVLLGSSAPFGERKPNTEKKQKKEAMGWHHLLIEPRRGQMLLQRDPRKLSWVCSQCQSNSHLQKWERLGPECLKSPVKKVPLWRKQMANSLLVGIWPINTRRTHRFSFKYQGHKWCYWTCSHITKWQMLFLEKFSDSCR